jgi:hypothetical protein
VKFGERVKRWFQFGEKAIRKRLQAERDDERDAVVRYLQSRSHRDLAYHIAMNRHRK